MIKKIKILSAPKMMQKGGIVVNQGAPDEQYDQQGNRVYYYPSQNMTKKVVIAGVPPALNIAPKVNIPTRKQVAFENELDTSGNLVGYRPMFQNFDYREANQFMRNLPYNSDNGVPYDRSPQNFGEANDNFRVGTNSNQWLPANRNNKVPMSARDSMPVPLPDSTFVNFVASNGMKFGGSNKKRVRITDIPDQPDMMANGGYADKPATRGYGMQQPGNGYSLDRRWLTDTGYPGGASQVDPYSKVGHTLPEATDPNAPNVINAERQEKVLGDFDQDGNQELMNVDGPPHTEGGKDVNVAPNSFVFSDTKDLKIKNPEILSIFGMQPKRGGYTPAQIATKYDLNKFKAITSNPKADDISKNTAQLMSDNYLSKLSQLAAVQEGMKKQMGLDHHDSDQPTAPIQRYGGIPKAQYGITGQLPPVTGDDSPNSNLGQQMQIAGVSTFDPNASWNKPYTVPIDNNVPSSDNGTQKQRSNSNKGWYPQVNPNFYGDLVNGLQMATLHKFHPFEPVPQAVIPQTTFVDPTRAIAAQQEIANTATQNANISANGRAARANSLAYQGEAGKGIADTIGQYANQNVTISNQANQQAAGITNDLMAKQANRLAELNKANFLSDRDYQREMGRLQAESVERQQVEHENAIKTAWLNKTSPYFNIDPVTQMPVFKSADAQARYQQTIYGAGNNGNSAQNTLKAQSDYYKYLTSSFPMYQGPGGESAARQAVAEKFGTRAYEDTNYKPGSVMPSGVNIKHQAPGSVYGEVNPYFGTPQQKWGGPNNFNLPHYQIGGAFAPVAGGPSPYDNEPVSPTPVQRVANTDNEQSASIPTRRLSKMDIATTTNNPGNMKYTSWMSNLGAVPSGIPGRDGGQFAEFPDLNTGFQAYKTQLFGDTDGIIQSKYYKPDTSVDQALKKWSNNGYGVEIYPEVKGKTLGQLTPSERDELARRQIKRESSSMYSLLHQRGVFKDGGFALRKFIK